MSLPSADEKSVAAETAEGSPAPVLEAEVPGRSGAGVQPESHEAVRREPGTGIDGPSVRRASVAPPVVEAPENFQECRACRRAQRSRHCRPFALVLGTAAALAGAGRSRRDPYRHCGTGRRPSGRQRPVSRGDNVTAGQVLVAIDNPELVVKLQRGRGGKVVAVADLRASRSARGPRWLPSARLPLRRPRLASHSHSRPTTA